mgnify:CR=1 FL=1
MNHQTYSNFVKAENDLTGLVAYAIYKSDKNRFKDGSPPPSVAQVEGFIQTVNMTEHVAAYRNRAVTLLEDMTEEAVGGAIEEIQKDFNTRLEKFEGTLGFWRSVWSNTLASFFVAFLFVILTLFVYGNKVGFTQVAGDAFDVDITPKAKGAGSAPSQSASSP